MSDFISKIIYWLPRILAVALTLSWLVYIALGHGLSMPGPAEISIAAVLTAAMLVAWKWPGIGAMIFFGLALFYMFMAWQRFAQDTILIVLIPLALVGGLFLLSKYQK
ncbi:hypothetical protein KJ969_03820 [Patescibacteria group bacterium]|nr:hypothetical protein [Patescibacteria group bacterium]MBU1921746.1 hypothetical protein [Patescibacteria group bacterium]